MESNSEITYTVLFLGTSGMLLLTCAIVIFIYSYQRKLIKRKLAFQEIEDMLKKQEMKSAYSILEGQDIERKRIAQELHDNLGSILVTLNMYADSALTASDISKKDMLLTRIGDIAVKANEETRKLSQKLDSGALKHFGLKTAVVDLLQVVREAKTIEVKSNIQLQDNIENEKAINLYRIVQELINNTLKHAGAEYLSVDITAINDEYISLIYQDNGIGFKEDKIRSGMGLKNIRARVENLAGKMNIESANNGVCIIIEIPLK